MATIRIISGDKEIMQLKNIRAGQTVLEVLLYHHIHIQHECGGMCTCSTCHIYVTNGMQYLERKSVREEHYLKKVREQMPSSRLSCQCLILEKNATIEIRIPKSENVL